jgi:hypothetical protein
VGVEVQGDGGVGEQDAAAGVVDRAAVFVECEGELGEDRCQRGEVAVLVDASFDGVAVGVSLVVAQQRADTLEVQLRQRRAPRSRR